MAIKAIINNTEKEIEQIKNSNEQDIDYVYSRIGDTEVESTPPISIKSIGGNLADYRIYGQTIDGESVGDRTGNLFDGEVELGSWDIITQPCSKIDAYHVRIRNANFIKVAENSTYSVTMSAEENVRLLIHFLDAQRNYISETTWINNISNFNTPSQCEYINIIFKKGNNEAIALSDIFNIMLNAGSTPLPYEPYGYKVPVTVEGKNLLQNTATSRTTNGVTITVNDDGSVTCNGIASKNTWIVLNTSFDIYAPDGRIVSMGNNGSTSTFFINISYVGDLTGSFNYSTTTHQNAYVHIVIVAGYTCNNLTIYPMIRRADIEDDTYEPYHAPITTNLYLPEQIKMVGDEAEYIDYGEQKQHRIGAEDIDVTLPALSTIKGTNTLSVNTSIQPSNIYIKDSFDYKKVFTATRVIEDGLPLNYKSIEDNDSTLSNYRIYGNTAGGESVGDKTENLFDMSTIVEGKYISSSGIETSSTAQYQENMLNHTDFINVSNDTAYSLTCVMPYSIALDNTIAFCWFDDNESLISRDTKRINDGNLSGYSFSAISPLNATYLIINFIGYVDGATYMLNSGSTALPYEPYGHRIPITNNSETANIYLDEPLRKVGDEAEYVDYAEQKWHRVRKNLLPNTATSQTRNGVTVTVNEDGSVTCNGTASALTIIYPAGSNYTLSKGTYKLTGCPIDGSGNTFCQDVYSSTINLVRDYGNGAEFNVTADGTISVRLIIFSGYTCDNLTFYPMIRKADIEDDTYEPYIENTDLDVTLPALPTLSGTNTLTVGTEVQPSSVEIKGHIK